MTHEQRIEEATELIERIIRNHQGKENAILVRQISAIVGLPGVTVRKIVKGLIEERGLNIGSSTNRPAGYYWIIDPAETEENYRALRHRGISILKRAACLKKIGIRKLLAEIQYDFDTELWPEEEE